MLLGEGDFFFRSGEGEGDLQEDCGEFHVQHFKSFYNHFNLRSVFLKIKASFATISLQVEVQQNSNSNYKVEKILNDSLDLIPSPSPSIMSGKVSLL